MTAISNNIEIYKMKVYPVKIFQLYGTCIITKLWLFVKAWIWQSVLQTKMANTMVSKLMPSLLVAYQL